MSSTLKADCKLRMADAGEVLEVMLHYERQLNRENNLREVGWNLDNHNCTPSAIFIYENYVTGSPGYCGSIIYVQWDGAPEFLDAFTLLDDRGCEHCKLGAWWHEKDRDHITTTQAGFKHEFKPVHRRLADRMVQVVKGSAGFEGDGEA